VAFDWIGVGKLVLSNLDTIVHVVKPAFTRKKLESVPDQADLLNKQIAELQAASSNNAEQIRALATQLKEVVTALEEATLEARAAQRRMRNLSIAAIVLSVAALLAAIAVLASR
jgi:hypothetical protein